MMADPILLWAMTCSLGAGAIPASASGWPPAGSSPWYMAAHVSGYSYMRCKSKTAVNLVEQALFVARGCMQRTYLKG